MLSIDLAFQHRYFYTLIAEFMEEMCFEPCPQDCEMSPWSSWTKCHVEHCGIGYQNRSRYVIEPELDGGRQCPDLYEGEVRLILIVRLRTQKVKT